MFKLLLYAAQGFGFAPRWRHFDAGESFMKRYSTIMSVLVTLALPVAGTCADAPMAPEKADAKVEAVAAPKAAEKADAKAPEKAESKAEAIQKSMSKSGHSMMGGAAPADAGAAPVNTDPTGKVVETMEGGGYTYANLEVAGGTKTWVAYPVLETRVGDTLAFKGCMPMNNFQSKTLNRKFDTILFCNAPEVGNKNAAKPAKEAKKAAPGEKIKVEKASGANAYTVEEIFTKRGTLNGKQVLVRGQVVKVASGIMNKNWLHLQDGTGNDKKKTNDLVVTTTDNAEEGDIITVSGTLAKDKDFGGGYKYTAIIEKGSVTK